MSYSIRAIVGGQEFELPDWHPDTSISCEMQLTGSLDGKYLSTGKNVDLLAANTILVVRYAGFEGKDARFWCQAGSGESAVGEGSEYVRVVAKSIKDVFRKTIVRLSSKPYKPYKFEDKKVGYILDRLFTDAQDRGAMTGLDWDFTTTHDSAGNAWADTIEEIEFPPGSPYDQTFSDMMENGYCEIRLDGTTIQAYNFGQMGSDKSGSVRLIAGRDLQETPSKWSIEDRAKYSLALGDGSAWTERVRAETPTGPFGREEQAISFGGTKKKSTLDKVNDASLEKVSGTRREYPRKSSIAAGGPKPFVDYNLGDTIMDLVGPVPQTLRVRAFILQPFSEGGTVSIALNDRFLENEIKQAKKMRGISTPSGGTSNGLPAVFVPDDTVPSVPTGVTITSGPYTDNFGLFPVARSAMQIVWDAPTMNTDLSAIDDIGLYEVRYKRTIATEWITATTSFTYIQINGLYPGDQYDVQVRCWDLYGNVSDWTGNVSSGPLAGDSDAPPKPSTPVVTGALRGINIEHDGKDYLGDPMPADLQHFAVHISKTAGFTPNDATFYSRMFVNGGRLFCPSPDNTPTYVRVIAYDASQNDSDPSDEASATPTAIIAEDLGVVLPGAIGFTDTDNVIMDGSFESTVLNGIRESGSDNIGSWSITSADKAHGANSLSATGDATSSKRFILTGSGLGGQLDRAFVAPGSKMYLNMKVKGVSGANGTVKVTVHLTSQAGTESYSSISKENGPTGDWEVVEGVVSIPDGTAWVDFQIETSGHTTGVWYFDSVQAKRVVPTELIEDAAITRAKIANAAIGTAQVEELEVGVLTGGVLNAPVIVGDRIATGEQDEPRIELNNETFVIFKFDDLGNLVQGSYMDPNGSRFDGNALLQDVDIRGILTLLGQGNRIAQNAKVTLESGITAPTVAPTVQASWPTIQLKDENNIPITGVRYVDRAPGAGGTVYWWAMTVVENGSIHVTQHNLTTGAFVERHLVHHKDARSDLYPHQPYTNSFLVKSWDTIRNSPQILMLGRRNDDGVLYSNSIGLYVYTSTSDVPADADADSYSGGWSSYGKPDGVWTFDGSPCLTRSPDDGGTTNLFVVAYSSSSSDKEIFRTVDLSLQEIQKTVSNATVTSKTLNTPRGAAAGQFDIGDSTVHYAYGNDGFYRFTNDSTEANETNYEFAAVSTSVIALGWNGASFWSADSSGHIYTHDGISWSDASYQKELRVAYSWYDSDLTGGKHETTLSPETKIQAKKRARLAVTSAVWTASGTDGVNGFRVYAGVGTGTKYLQGAFTVQTSQVTALAVTGNTIVDKEADFPAATPAELLNTTATLSIKGDGNAKFPFMPKINTDEIVAYATGSNGSYLRFSVGIQICWHQFSITPVANDPTDRTWTFPAAFVATPTFAAVIPETTVPYSSVRETSYSDLTTTTMKAWVYRVNTTSTTVSMLAIGLWK